MRNFGNFLVKQIVELNKELIAQYKRANEPMFDRDSYIELRAHYISSIKKMDYNELIAHAKVVGVKVPVPANY